tara:strand:- start:3457 stop:3831 length:375 start_codon:yes stop_codon:yes gene_type:complete
MSDKANCIINPATNRAVKTSTRLGKRLLAEAQGGGNPKPVVKKTATKRPAIKDQYSYLDVLTADELGEALMHYYRKNTTGDALWNSFLTKSRSQLMTTIVKYNIKLNVNKPLTTQPKGPDPTKK